MLCIPLLMCGIFSLIEAYNEEVWQSLGKLRKDDKTTLEVGLVTYLVGQFIPLCAQLGSLVFGHIRKS